MTGGLILDIAVVSIVLFSVTIAVLRGFIREVLTVLGLIGGAAAAYVLGPLLVGTTRGWLGVTENSETPQELFGMIPYSLVADALAYGMVFIVFLIVLSVISYFLSKFVKSIGLGAVDRALGAVFGIVRAALVLGLLYLPFYYTLEDDEQKDEWFGDSKTQVYVEASSRFVDGYIPKSAHDAIEQGVEEAGVVSEARKKMEELDILRGEKDVPASDGQSIPNPKKGYTEEFREGMDQLMETIDENVDVKPPAKNYNE